MHRKRINQHEKRKKTTVGRSSLKHQAPGIIASVTRLQDPKKKRRKRMMQTIIEREAQKPIRCPDRMNENARQASKQSSRFTLSMRYWHALVFLGVHLLHSISTRTLSFRGFWRIDYCPCRHCKGRRNVSEYVFFAFMAVTALSYGHSLLEPLALDVAELLCGGTHDAIRWRDIMSFSSVDTVFVSILWLLP